VNVERLFGGQDNSLINLQAFGQNAKWPVFRPATAA